MRKTLGIVAVLVTVGTAALHYGFTRGQLGEWEAGVLPYPGAGFSSYDAFQLHRGGRFELQVLSPGTDRERAGLSEERASIDLRVVLDGPHGFHLDKVIQSVRIGSWSVRGRTFSPNEVWVLPPGEYEIRIEGRGPVPPVFRERGATICLGRMEPVGPDLGIQLSKRLGYFLLAAAAGITVLLAVRKRPVRDEAVSRPDDPE